MLLTVRSLLGEPIEATDGLIGRIDSFLFAAPVVTLYVVALLA